MFKINHKEFSELIKEYYKKKLALFCLGAFGIGKSFVVRDVSKEIAEERKRKFVEWNKLSKKEKQEIYNSPEKYFCLLDIRMSEQDPSDVKGLPDFRDGKETVEWKIPFWAKYLSLENSDGILFLDEFNLGTPLVMSSFYKVLYDRCVNDGKMSDNWLVLGAGNRDSDRGFTHTIPEPLLDRGGCCELIGANVEDWTKWAIKNKIDSRIIGYLNFKQSDLQKVDFKDNQKQTTCRGWERLSNLIKDVKDYSTMELLCKSAIGEGIAISFIAFLKIQEKMKLEDVIKYPEKIKKIETPDVKYFLVSAVAEKYGDNKNKQVDFDKVIEISKVFDACQNAEFTALLWRLCSSYAPEKFKKEFLNAKGIDAFINRYGRFIV